MGPSTDVDGVLRAASIGPPTNVDEVLPPVAVLFTCACQGSQVRGYPSARASSVSATPARASTRTWA